MSSCLLLSYASCQEPQKSPEPNERDSKKSSTTFLFEDTMTKNWKEKWFLDGKLATIEHRKQGLYFSGGTITKPMDSKAYHAHHAVLWTKQVFEGDLKISYDFTRIDASDYGTTLLYIQAQGIDTDNYPEDIVKWNDDRKIPAMSKYYENMDLISLSFRENLRCKRYPWKDHQGEWYPQRGLIDPKVEYPGIIPGKRYRVEVTKRGVFVHLKLFALEAKKLIVDHSWNTTQTASAQHPKLIKKGRIGLRHMSTKQMIYHNFKVEQL